MKIKLTKEQVEEAVLQYAKRSILNPTSTWSVEIETVHKDGSVTIDAEGMLSYIPDDLEPAAD